MPIVPGTSSSELDSLISAQPRTKEDFIKFSDNIIAYIIKRHQDKPLYNQFVEHHVRALAQPLRDVEVRKAASGLTTLANEKQKEARDKTSGKKKTKSTAKPVLGASKPTNKCVRNDSRLSFTILTEMFCRFDTSAYEEALDDFGDNPDDFM